MRPRIRRPLLAAAGFLALAGLLASLGEGRRPTRARPDVEFPRWMRPVEVERLEARRTLSPAPAVSRPAGPAPGGEPAAIAIGPAPEPPGPRDPFLVALPRDATRPLVVFEANALRHSRIGELFVACLSRSRESSLFEEARRELGIDPLKDVDRVAVSDGGYVVSGFFERARLERLEREYRSSSRGEHGRVYAPPGAGSGTLAVGTWRDRLIVLGEPTFVEGALDRMEETGLGATAIIPERLTYGEAYGVVPGSALRSLLHGDQSGLGQRLADVASRIELHVDAMRDVAVVASVSGEDAAGLDDLGKAFGAALAVGRIQAAARGDSALAELLEHARVERHGRGFSMELALPVEVVERWFRGCETAETIPPPADAPGAP